MYNKWEKYHEYDSKNPTFSSTLLDKINKSLKNNSKIDLEEDLSFFRSSKGVQNIEEEKILNLRRANLVEKWMEKKVISEKVRKNSKVKSCNTLLEEFDVQDTLFFSTTSTSSSSSEAEYFDYAHPRPQQKPRVTCFAPPKMPKPVKTRPVKVQVESKQNKEKGSSNCKSNSNSNDKDSELLKSKSRSAKIYSNLKNLNKQPISPGVRLTSFINSLFTKEKKNNKKKSNNNNVVINNNSVVVKPDKIKASYSTCTTPTSYSRSCFNNKEKKLFQDDGIKRTVKFCPVSVIVDEDLRPCGQKSVFNDRCDRNLTSNFARTLSKRYEELKILNGLERKNDGSSVAENNKKLEEVTLDLLSGYCWDSRLSRETHDLYCEKKVNYSVNCDRRDGNYDCSNDDEDENENENDDGLSCSSSDLFELDHLSLIGNNELPVYETTRFDPKIH